MSSVLLVADGHYYRTPSGDVYTYSVFNYDFYSRYLSAFEKVYAIGRMEAVDKPPIDKDLASGPNVVFLDLYPGKGIEGFIKTYFKNQKLLKKYMEYGDCGIFRLPGVVANQAIKQFYATEKPFAVEVVTDPYVYFGNNASGGKLAPIIRSRWTKELKRACLEANGVSYVTERYLQERYPCQCMFGNSNNFSSYYSSVELPDDMFAEAHICERKEKYVLSHAANAFNGNAKGHITLLKALSEVRKSGYDVDVIFVGDGASRKEYEELALSLDIDKNVHFVGAVADGNKVREIIRNSDIFVFPTQAEGLPRVLLEAMAEGIPCIASGVCGIPEIIGDDFLCDPNDFNGFAQKIIRLINNPELAERASTDNLKTAKKYSKSELQVRRTDFYKTLARIAKQ